MRRIGRAFAAFRSRSTCQHKGRVFGFSQASGKLLVAELLPGDRVRCVAILTEVDCEPASIWRIACCSIGDRILAMIGKKKSIFAALVDVGRGELSARAIHITSLAVSGARRFPGQPFLCQAGENRALLYFDDQDSMWYCDVAGDALKMRKLRTRMPTEEGFSTVPIRLPNGKLLVAGAYPVSADITLISCDGDPRFEKLGDIPGVERKGCSSILIGDRFVVGFGGHNNSWLDDLWIFDLRTRRSSIVWEKGEWALPTGLPVLILQRGTLYIIGSQIHSIGLLALSRQIDDDGVRNAFCAVLGLPLSPRYEPPPRRIPRWEKMMRLAGSPYIRSRTTVQCKGRIFGLSLGREEIVVSEVVFFGRGVK